MQAGIEGIKFWIGEVVHRDDLSNAGRVKVRVFGVHDETVTHNDLPWAPVVDGSHGAAQALPRRDAWVFGAFLDGKDGQHPIVLGTLPGFVGQMGETAVGGDTIHGSADRVRQFGRSDIHPAILGEGVSDLSGVLLARADNDRTSVDSMGRQWTEVRYVLPDRNVDNRVISSGDGQNFIVLGSQDNGLFQVTTCSGSVVQIDKNGTVYIKANQGGMNIVANDGRIDDTKGSHITNVNGGDWLLAVGGNGRIHMQGDLDVEVENFNLTVRGDYNVNVGRTYNTRAADIKLMSHTNDINIVSQQALKMQSTLGSTTIRSLINIYLESLIDTRITAGLDTVMQSLAGDMELYATTGITMGSAASDVDISAVVGNVNINSLNRINLGAGSVYLDLFVRMATGGALGTAFPATPSLTAAALGITPVGVGLPDVPPSQTPLGYKALNFQAQGFPVGASTTLTNLGGNANQIPAGLSGILDRASPGISNKINTAISQFNTLVS